MIFYSGGGKGGVGKSMMTLILLDNFIRKSERPILIETDTDNPDTFKASTKKNAEGKYEGKDCDAYAFNIDTVNGWEKTLDVIGANPDRPIIINSGARNTMTISKYGDVLNELPDFTTLWLINNKADSLNLLGKFLDIVKQPICVVKNGFYAEPEDFTAFDESKFPAAGMKSVYLPQATESVTDAIYTKRRSIAELESELSFGQKLLARSWINKISTMADECLANAQKITLK